MGDASIRFSIAERIDLQWGLPVARLWATRLVYLPAEVWDALRGRRGPLDPPRWGARLMGGGDFFDTGALLLENFRSLTGLAPHEHVLDVGCGFGRVAVALTGYLVPPGIYRGFDTIRPAVRWCQNHITPAFPSFLFEHADVANPEYNPRGRHPAEEYVFPYADTAFDFVFATSVFTHMLPAGMANYLAEISRVLRPGGRLYATFFLLDDEALRRVSLPGHPFPFVHEVSGGARAVRPERPETAVGYLEKDVRAAILASGLRIREPIRYGEWSGREGAEWGQDIVIASKE